MIDFEDGRPSPIDGFTYFEVALAMFEGDTCRAGMLVKVFAPDEATAQHAAELAHDNAIARVWRAVGVRRVEP